MTDIESLFGFKFEAFEIGEEAWIYLHGHQGEMTKGKVVAILDLPGWGHPNYVIEIDTPMDPLLEVRGSPLAIRKRPPHDPDKPDVRTEMNDLIQRLQECHDRICKMCREGRPPRMTIPARDDDDDLFISRTCREAAAALARKPVGLSDYSNAELFAELDRRSERLCPECEGFGVVPSGSCERCNGSGFASDPDNITVTASKD